MKNIFKNEKSVKTLAEIRKFLLSDRWMVTLAIFSLIIACLHAHLPEQDFHIWGSVVLGYITGVCFLLTGDVMAMLIPTLFTYVIAMRCYNSLEAFSEIWYLAIPLIFMLLFNLIYYGKKPSAKGSQFFPMLLVSIAVTIGGVGVITPQDYFGGASIYNMLGIGFGMLFVYCIFFPRINATSDYSLIDKLSKIMVMVGLTASLAIFAQYIININDVIDDPGIIYMRWRNNTSTILMIALPFAFFRANKSSYSIIIGFIYYVAMLLTGSRGGMVFGTIELVMCIVMFVLYDKRRRLAYAIICGCFVIAALIYLPEITEFLNYTLKRLFRVINQFLMGGEDTETRVRHYARGIKDYLNHPVFGTGLGNMTNRDIFKNKPGALCWYHCEPIQIAGSFGTVGIIAFIYQFIKRNILIWKKATLFNMTIFLSYISLELMSLVNPGILCPVPYLLLITIFMIIVEKCDDGEEQVKIPILKKFRDKREAKKNAKQELVTK